jgi:hypothetical protein
MDIHQAVSAILGGGRRRPRQPKPKKTKRPLHTKRCTVEIEPPALPAHGPGTGTPAQKNTEAPIDKTLTEMNALVENLADVSTELPQNAWTDWLWGSDPNELPTAEAFMNRNQLLGLLLCRYRAARSAPHKDITRIHSALLNIIDTPPCEMSLRELRDGMSNLMIMWNTEVHAKGGGFEQGRTNAIRTFLDGYFHRLGEFAWAQWECDDPNSPIAEDVGSIEVVVHVNNLGARVEYHQLTLSSLRNLINTFFIAYRMVHWMGDAAENEMDETPGLEHQNPPKCSKIHNHHVSASTDTFYRLGMYYDLPPAGRLNYRHNFSGLYNCVSQPAYYHNPDYIRRIPGTAADVLEGKSDIHQLAVLLQVYPEVLVLYDDEDFTTALPQSISALGQQEKRYAWRWLLTAGRVYLLRWDPIAKSHACFREPDGNLITCLEKRYLVHRAQIAAEVDAPQNRGRGALFAGRT